ncbi:hypothetical protein CTE07_38940 [Chitinophaga terrae (ex Kim and Jung 2007)]|nr:hypothetical protein CTE07_38940 [Chitinophaga terrae (ex Kim and Jung 2007)]
MIIYGRISYSHISGVFEFSIGTHITKVASEQFIEHSETVGKIETGYNNKAKVITGIFVDI